MGANKLESFETLVINRNDIQKADYNPRTITDAAAKKLRKFLRENGLWSPLIVNKRSMVLVSGHQRLTAMDAILKTDDYQITVAMVDVDEATEVKGNIFMNNQSAMGEWDYFKLEEIHSIFPDLDFEKDFAFDASDVDIILGEQPKKDNIQKTEYTSDTFREAKKAARQKAKEETHGGDSYRLSENDYQVTIVFPNNHDKKEFMKRIRKDVKEKFIKSSVLHDIAKGVYSLSILDE